MLNKFISNNILILSSFLIILIFIFYSFFYASVIRTVEEDELVKKGFDAKAYVENIWKSKIIPTISQDAQDITFILDELFKNKEVTEEKYGDRSGTGSYSFMIKGKGEVTSLNTASRVGTLSIKLEKLYDSEIFITLGPVIKKDSIRDSVKFIQFNDFVNQLDFADVSRIIKTRVLNEIIGPLNLKEIVGKKINFEGAITFDRKDKIYITPTKIDFID
jgi:predicted lipoprotein